MKIQKILERAKFAKDKVIAYHGTSKKNLESIIKNGLIMNHGEDGLGSGEYDERGFGYSFEPHEGVYFSTTYRFAVNSARNVDHDNPIVIIAQIQMKSSYLDEDDIFEVIGVNDMEILQKVEKARLEHGDIEDSFFEEIDDISDEEQVKALKSLRHNLRNKYEINPTSVEHIVQNAAPYVKRFIDALITGAVETGEADIRSEQEALRKILKNVTRQHDHKNLNTKGNTNFSVPHNIGFRGANKIVGIVDPQSDKLWGYKPDADMYKKVKSPLDLLK